MGTLKIVSWNCCYIGGFNPDKVKKISELNADILIIQECTYFECVGLNSQLGPFTWYGDGKDSMLGIGIFSKKYTLKLSDKFSYSNNFRYVIPYLVTGEGKEFTLIAVWTKAAIAKEIHNLSYDENVIEAIEHYKIEKQSIVIGDYNTFAHDANTGYRSLVNCARGSEASKDTFCSQNGDFGIDDFCFASPDIAEKVNVKVYQNSHDEWKGEGKKKYWQTLSDHCPIIVTFDF
jgi:exonuclease III